MARRISAVWEIFESMDEDKRAKCKLCQKSYSRSGGTSNLRDHIRRRHPNMVDGEDIKVLVTHERKSHGLPIKKVLVTPTRKEPPGLDRALALCMAKDLQSFSMVEDEGFKEFVELLNPKYKLPCRRTVSQVLVPGLCEEARTKLQIALATAQHIALTTDTWTSNHECPFLAVTAHFVHNGKLTSGCLDVCVLPGKHTVENVADCLRDIMAGWQIQGKVSSVTTDNASNMRGAVQRLNLRHLPCAAHTLHLVVCDSIKEIEIVSDLLTRCSEIVTYFKHTTAASDLLRTLQQDAEAPVLQLIQQVATRWNSKLEMVRRLLDVKDYIAVAEAHCINMPHSLTAEEWMVLDDFVIVLQPFEAMTAALSTEIYVTASQIIPLVHGLYVAITSCLPLRTSTGVSLREVVVGYIQSRLFNYEVNPVARAATFLDPRFKKIAFQVEEKAAAAQEQVEEEVGIEIMRQHNTEAATESSEFLVESGGSAERWQGHALLGFLSIRVAEESSAAATTDAATLVRQYIERLPVSSSVNPINYWEGKEEGLTEVAHSYLCVPATSVPCQQLFSETGLTLSDRRNALSQRKTKELMFLKGNEDVLKF